MIKKNREIEKKQTINKNNKKIDKKILTFNFKLLIIFILAFVISFYGFSLMLKNIKKISGFNLRLKDNKNNQANIIKPTISEKPKSWLESLFPKKKINYQLNKDYLYIDPVLLKNLIDKKDQSYLLVDVRSKEEYQLGHIRTATNAPIYEDYKDVYGSLVSKNNWWEKVEKLVKKKKWLIIYGYSPQADIILDLASYLKTKKPTKILNVSWYQWRNDFHHWLPEAGVVGFDVGNYIEPKDQINTGAPLVPVVPGFQP